MGFLIEEKLPNDVKTVYTPNERNQLTKVVSTNSAGTTLLSLEYLLDKTGNRTQVTEAGGGLIEWRYDKLSQLTEEIRGGITTHFEYDAAGNRDWVSVNGVMTMDYDYNALDQLTIAGTATYDYDDRGNLSQITNGSNVSNYTYNSADQLTGVSAPGISASYGYDADGRRVKQTIGSTVTNYLWDEASPYGDVALETDASNAMLARYVLGRTELISQTRGATTSYFLQDGQGSTRALTSSTGTVTDTYSYTAFGELLNHTGTTVNPYQYTGQQFDSLTGLYSLRARYYNPALGRFLSQDTYPYNFSNPVELNRYGYTTNNPINLVDPSGHDSGSVGYSISLSNVFASARAAAELGFKVGLVYGIVASLMCTDSPSEAIGFIATSAVMGYVGGGLLGGIAAIPRLAGLAQALGATGGLVGYALAAEDIRANGLNGCNFISAVGSLAAFGGSTFSGFSGGGPSMQFAFAGVGGRASASVVQGTASNVGAWGGLGLISMISRGGGDSGDIDPEEAQDLIDSVVENEYDNSFFRRQIEGKQIIFKRPRFWPQYDPNVLQYGESHEAQASKIGPASIRGGRREILETIIHEEVHHWLDEQGIDQSDIDKTEKFVRWLTAKIMGPYR